MKRGSNLALSGRDFYNDFWPRAGLLRWLQNDFCNWSIIVLAASSFKDVQSLLAAWYTF
jgi:hypothetical protein